MFGWFKRWRDNQCIVASTCHANIIGQVCGDLNNTGWVGDDPISPIHIKRKDWNDAKRRYDEYRHATARWHMSGQRGPYPKPPTVNDYDCHFFYHPHREECGDCCTSCA